jgi:hypothetical protein
VLAIIRPAIFRQDSFATGFPIANPRHRLLAFGSLHCVRMFRALQTTHSPAAHTTDGFITPHDTQLHSPDPLQCQHVGVPRKTSRIAVFASRTRSNSASSNFRFGLRHRTSPSTVTLTPRPSSSVKISVAWVIRAPCRQRRFPTREPQSKFGDFREPEIDLCFHLLHWCFQILVCWFPLYS